MCRKVYWLVYIDTADDPIRVLSVSKEDAKEQVQEMCYDEGYGELNVGPIGLVNIVREDFVIADRNEYEAEELSY